MCAFYTGWQHPGKEGVMDENVQRFLAGIKVGAKQSHENMTIYCLLAAQEADVDFVTMDEALEKGFLSVTSRLGLGLRRNSF
jgi:hypothetical protein